jgi:ubiquinone/menaquinone biosynthesis C-methylase UbiE
MHPPVSVGGDMSAQEADRANWTRVDETGDPRWFIRLLDATRSRMLRTATADPAAHFAYLDLVPGLVVLDVGSGTGDFDRLLAGLVAPDGRVVGIDYGQTMVDEATARAAGLGLPLEFRQGDAHELPLADATFDRCLATQVFQHLPRPERALAEMVRVARSGGRVVVTEPDWDSRVCALGDSTLARALSRAWADKITNPGIARELPAMFVAAGLTNVRLDAMPYLLSSHLPEMTRDLVAQPLRELCAAGVIDGDRLDRALALVETRIAAGTWVDAAFMLRVTGEKR